MKSKGKKRESQWGFDTKSLNKEIRPQDDFYTYANGTWLKKTKIPPEESRWGSFLILRHDTEMHLKSIMDTLLAKKTYPKGSPEQMVRDLYHSAMDMKRRNALGAKPLMPLRAKVASINSSEELLSCISYLHKEGVSGIWNAFVDQDSKDSTSYILHLWQGGLGMPDREYYLLDVPEQKRVRDAYILHIEKLLKIAGYTGADARKAREIVMKIETRLARASMKKEDLRDPQKVYHKISPSPLWKKYFAQLGAPSVSKIIVAQPLFFKEALSMLTSIPLDEWKVYLDWHSINDCAGNLSEAFIKEQFHFYSKVLRGTKKMKPLWRRSLMTASGALGDSFGKLYVDRYFPQSAKKKMDTLVSNLFEVYEARIRALDWMGQKTKKKAIAKLHAMNRKIAYPKKWDLYKGVVITPDDYFGNIDRIHAHEHKKMMRKLTRGIDRDEWFMSPQTVNAYFAPNLNDIVFPAAILQWPFFDPTADDALNYAGIGSAIGHEMTHAFDDSGSKFDINGNLNNWWTPADKRAFEKKGQLIVAQANAHTVVPGITLNGKLTLGENIADLGGLVIAYDAYQRHLAKTGKKIINDLTPEQRFFLAFAQTERELGRPETIKVQALTDPHAAPQFRINAPLSNFEPFYEAFGVKRGDALYREEKKRAKIW